MPCVLSHAPCVNNLRDRLLLTLREHPKAFWNYARTRMKTRPAIGNIEGIDGKLYTSDEDKSNALNR